MSEKYIQTSDTPVEKLIRFSDTLKVLRIEQPFDEEEKYLLESLDALHREFVEIARPITDRLVQIRASKPINYVMVPK